MGQAPNQGVDRGKERDRQTDRHSFLFISLADFERVDELQSSLVIFAGFKGLMASEVYIVMSPLLLMNKSGCWGGGGGVGVGGGGGCS